MAGASPLVSALLGGESSGAGALGLDPNVLAASPQLSLAQVMAQNGMDASPAYPMQAIARAAQGVLAPFVRNQAISQLANAYAGAAKGWADTIPENTSLGQALRSPDPSVRMAALAQAPKAALLLTENAGEGKGVGGQGMSPVAGAPGTQFTLANSKAAGTAQGEAPFKPAGTVPIQTPNGVVETPITASTLAAMQPGVRGVAVPRGQGAPSGTPGVAPTSTGLPIASVGQVESEKEHAKTIAEEGGKGQMVPIAETMKEARTAPQALNALNVIEDVAKTYGDKITTGPFADQALKVRQALVDAGWMKPDEKVAPAELIKKMNAQLASASVNALTARGTQFDFKTFMENNPGLNNTVQGTLFLSNILKQVHRQNLDLASLARNEANWPRWDKVQADYYAQHPLVNPMTGHALGVGEDTKDQKSTMAAPKAGTPSIPAGAIEHLRQNPQLANAFNAKYGPGAAERVLGSK